MFGDSEHIEIVEVKDTRGNVMVEVSSDAPEESFKSVRNAFASSRLRQYHEEGYVAVAVGGSNENHSAWFERADTIDFGDPSPEGQYELGGDWSASVTDYVTLRHDGDVVCHIPRDGWTIDSYITYVAIPSSVMQDLEDIGFERSDGPLTEGYPVSE